MHLRFLTVFGLLALPSPSFATEWFVQPGGGGTGTRAAPFARIQDAINRAQPGDTVSVLAGTYPESIATVRGGTADKRIVIRAVGGRGSVMITTSSTVLTIAHPYIDVEGVVVDAQYAAADAVSVRTTGNHFALRNSEVRRTAKDAIDLGAPAGVLIENCLIHHALNAAGGRTDAHGIVAGAVKGLTIRGTEIHTFSGDAIQVDPGRSSPGWTDLTIEGCRLWLQPLPAAENGFAAGTVPGENALDTKAGLRMPRAKVTIRDTVAYGFRNGLISNMAAFNLKENVDATVDGVTVYDSEIAFRVRGAGADRAAALVTVKNAVIHSTAAAFRYEDAIDSFHVWNSTIGQGVSRAFRPASATGNPPDVRNVLIVASALPAEAARASNMAVAADVFVNAATHNYVLAKGARPIDAGTQLAEVKADRQGTARPQGAAWDIGAYEFRRRQPSDKLGDSRRHVHRRAQPEDMGRLFLDRVPSVDHQARVPHDRGIVEELVVRQDCDAVDRLEGAPIERRHVRQRTNPLPVGRVECRNMRIAVAHHGPALLQLADDVKCG